MQNNKRNLTTFIRERFTGSMIYVVGCILVSAIFASGCTTIHQAPEPWDSTAELQIEVTNADGTTQWKTIQREVKKHTKPEDDE